MIIFFAFFSCVVLKKGIKFTIFLSVQFNSVSIFILLWNSSPELFHLAKLKLYIHETIPHFPLQFLVTTILLSMNLTTLIPHVSGSIQYFSFCDWLISISIMSSLFVHVVTCDRIFFLFKAGIIFHCVYIYHIFLSSIHPWMDFFTLSCKFSCFNNEQVSFKFFLRDFLMKLHSLLRLKSGSTESCTK